jgi:hypothetical protein
MGVNNSKLKVKGVNESSRIKQEKIEAKGVDGSNKSRWEYIGVNGVNGSYWCLALCLDCYLEILVLSIP